MNKISHPIWYFKLLNLYAIQHLKEIAYSCGQNCSVPILIEACSVLYRLIYFLKTLEKSQKVALPATYELDIRQFAGVVLRQSKSKCESKDIVFIEKVLKFLASLTFTNKYGVATKFIKYKPQRFQKVELTLFESFIEFCEKIQLLNKGKPSIKLFEEEIETLNSLRKTPRAFYYFIEKLYVCTKRKLYEEANVPHDNNSILLESNTKPMFEIVLEEQKKENERKEKSVFALKKLEQECKERLEFIFKRSTKSQKISHPITFAEIKRDSERVFAKLNIDDKFINSCAIKIINSATKKEYGKTCRDLYKKKIDENKASSSKQTTSEMIKEAC